MLDRLRRMISTQLSRPSGLLGRFVAAGMNRGNRDLNQRAIDLLDVRAGTRVLDLGFGGGGSFGPLLARGARIVGVDRAADMVAAVAEHHRDDSRVEVLRGDVTELPLEDASVDRVLTVNTVYFWHDLAPAMSELHRVTAPGGRIVIGIRDGSVMERVDTAIFTIRPPEAIASALAAAGFSDPQVHSAPDRTSHLITTTR